VTRQPRELIRKSAAMVIGRINASEAAARLTILDSNCLIENS
jgi:hypothetical protein